MEGDMEVLLTAIVVWLSANFDLPANFNHPRVMFVPPNQMVALRFKLPIPMQEMKNSAAIKNVAQADKIREVVAVYDNQKKVIYLPDKWTGHTAANLSVVVHEMVHHLQHAGGLKYECMAAREKLAYEAQAKWLALFGRNLESEFQIDRLTILVAASCAFETIFPP
jgi:Zn-dependent membrane protease YugP